MNKTAEKIDPDHIAPPQYNKILIILHGPLEYIMLHLGGCATIRRTIPNAEITLLTTRNYASMLQSSGYFNNTLIDPMPHWLDFKIWWSLGKRIRDSKFDMIYDFQKTPRTEWYFKILGRKKPNWCGNINWCSHPVLEDEKAPSHPTDSMSQQLKLTGIPTIIKPNINWLKEDLGELIPKKEFAIIAPGGTSHNEYKSWSLIGYADLCKWLEKQNITPVFIGEEITDQKVSIIKEFNESTKVINLANKLSFGQIAELARNAAITIGNEAGLTHFCSYTDCPTLMILSPYSDPSTCKPIAKNALILEDENLDNLAIEDVEPFLKELLSIKDKKNK